MKCIYYNFGGIPRNKQSIMIGNAYKNGGEKMEREIALEVWGDFACFCPSYAKVERLTSPVPTPSAARGIYSAIYSKPAEFYWQITRIEVLNPIRYISFKRNEVKSTINVKSKVEDSILYTDEDQNPEDDSRFEMYVIGCSSEQPQPTYTGTIEQLYSQALRRIRSAKAFYQPSLGLREFVCYFEESDLTRKPIEDSMDLGLMLYDVFDLHDYIVRKKTQPKVSLYHAIMEHGVIQVPPYDSDEVLKGGAYAKSII